MAPAMTAVSKPKSSPPRAATTVLFKSVEFSFMAPARGYFAERFIKAAGLYTKKKENRKRKMGGGELGRDFSTQSSQRTGRRKRRESARICDSENYARLRKIWAETFLCVACVRRNWDQIPG